MSKKIVFIFLAICLSFTALAGNGGSPSLNLGEGTDSENSSLSITEHRSLFRLRTNLAADALTVANLGAEFSISCHLSLGLDVTFSPWDITPTRKLRTLLLLPEMRYYFWQDYKWIYLGAHAHAGFYNVAWDTKTRYQHRDGKTPLWGGGLSLGVVIPFGKHFGMDLNLGGGYARLEYDEYYNLENGAKYTTTTKDWWGPTRAGLSIFYRF